MKRGILYCRVSTDKQLRNNSIPVQKQIGKEYFQREHIQLVQTFTDDISGKNFNRPGFEAMRKYCQKHHESIDTIIVIDWSRFGRSTVDSLIEVRYFKELDIKVQSIEQPVDDNPESLLIQLIYMGSAEVDNKRRAVNVVKGMKASLRKGVWCGGKLPVGYARDKNTGHYSFTPAADHIKKAYDMIMAGHTTTQVKDHLNSLGFNRSVKAWAKILRNPFYKGIISHKLLEGATVPGQHPPLVSDTVWQQVQDILSGKSIERRPSADKDLFPLQGHFHCGKCDRQFTTYTVTKKRLKSGKDIIKKTPQAYYKCYATGCKTNVSAKKIHKKVQSVLYDLTLPPALYPILHEYMSQAIKKYSDRYRQELRVYESQKITLEERIQKLDIKYIDGDIDKSFYQEKKGEFQDELMVINERIISHADKLTSNPSKWLGVALDYATKIPSIWQETDIQAKKRLIKMVFPEGLWYDKEKDQLRTPRVNAFFGQIAEIRQKKENQHIENMLVLDIGSPKGPHSEPLFIEDIEHIYSVNETVHG